jgi:GntR family transcriptional regulator/MocR family aminotransferase
VSHRLGITLDERSDTPLYRQLFDQIVARIRNRTFPPRFRLPATRALADELVTHRNTVVRAYEDLKAAGFICSTVGRGTFVAEQIEERPTDSTTRRPSAGGMPWASLTSTAVNSEPMGRGERLTPIQMPGDTIALSRMQPSPDLLPSELLRRCLDHVLRTVGERALGYTPREGLPRLRALIADDLVRQGVPATADDLIITTGSQQALDMVARTLVNPGDTFLTDESSYSGALTLFTLAGARLIGLPSDEEGPEIISLERHAQSIVKGLYVMPNCQNPTGTRITQRRREALLDWSQKARVPLLEDDYASDLQLDEQPALTALRAFDGDVIYIGTYSKKLIPALRIGYLLCPAALRPHLLSVKQAIDIATSGILQHALAEFLERGYLLAHLKRIRAEYRRRRDALEAALTRYLPAEVRWRRPETGVVLWLPTPPALDPEALYREAQQHGVSISPGSLNAVGRQQQRGIRLTFCAEPPERLEEGAKRLGQAWAALCRRLPGQRTSDVALELV